MESQRQFYEEFFASELELPVEKLKQGTRLEVLAELIGGRKFEKALIIGCGQGDEIKLLSADSAAALDLSLNALLTAAKKVPSAGYLQGNALQLPFDSNTFDVALCSEVIEHVPDAGQLVSEIARVLKPDGRFYLSTPNWFSWWGFARKLAEFFLRRPVTSGGQPIDNWFYAKDLRKLLDPYFTVEKRRGIWYFPPTGLGMTRLPDKIVAPVMGFFMPVERVLSRTFPGFGHMHALCSVRKSNG